MFDRTLLRKRLAISEGKRNRMYKCPAGKWTIGYGWNIEDKGLPDGIIEQLLDIGINEAVALLDARIPWWRTLDDARQGVLVDMAFNMGGKLFTFVNTIAAIKRGEWKKAAAGMRASLWYRQVGDRAEHLAQIMEKGSDNPQ